jgi:hypothetical protein
MRFSYLRHLQLFMLTLPEDVHVVLYFVSFLSVTPFIEKLEVHVSDILHPSLKSWSSFGFLIG